MSDLSWLNPTPHAIAVYASQPLSPAAAQHSLPSGRYSLLGPDFHRLDRASFAWRTHSITSSARARSVGGTSRPSALAVLRLMNSSTFVTCWTGKSAGFSPLRMRSTYSPHSRYQLWIAAGHRRRRANSLDAPRQCFSGYLLMNPSRLGIFTLGKVSAFIASFSPIILLSARI